MMSALEQPAFLNLAPAGKRLRRLLLVAYNFPPVGGAGVQRPVKWVKNLRRFGWDVTVLTTANPSVPTRDESLLADIPDDVLVIRANTWEPDYRTKQGLVDKSNAKPAGFVARTKAAAKGLVKNVVKLALQPDPQVLWVPNAIKAGRRVLSEMSHDAILVTAPAYSSFFIGTKLKRQFGLPLVLDFRDEWDLSGRYLENAQRDRFSQTVQGWMQRRVLRQADAVVATTIGSAANLAGKLASVHKASTRSVTVYNGFDTEEFETHSSVSPPSVRSKFRLLYTGTLWNLTTIEPLVAAIQQLNSTTPDLLNRLELICVGRKTPEQVAILDRLRTTACKLELIDYCEHSKVIQWLQAADATCLLLSDVPGAERVVPAKLFEYLANGKEMLAIVPRGETADIARRFFPAGQYEPKDINGIAGWLTSRLTDLDEQRDVVKPAADINEYSRTTQTRRLVELLDEVVQDREVTR